MKANAIRVLIATINKGEEEYYTRRKEPIGPLSIVPGELLAILDKTDTVDESEDTSSFVLFFAHGLLSILFTTIEWLRMNISPDWVDPRKDRIVLMNDVTDLMRAFIAANPSFRSSDGLTFKIERSLIDTMLALRNEICHRLDAKYNIPLIKEFILALEEVRHLPYIQFPVMFHVASSLLGYMAPGDEIIEPKELDTSESKLVRSRIVDFKRLGPDILPTVVDIKICTGKFAGRVVRFVDWNGNNTKFLVDGEIKSIFNMMEIEVDVPRHMLPKLWV